MHNIQILLILMTFGLLASLKIVSNDYNVTQITEPIDFAECPSWDHRNGILYFVNMLKGEIYRYEYATGTNKSIKLGGIVAGVVQSKNNTNLLIVGLNRSVIAVEWNGKSPPSHTRILATLPGQYPTSKVNEGKADKQGRYWIGTKGYNGSNYALRKEGALYQVTCNHHISVKVKIAPVNISNGMTWNRANDRFFYIDTPTRQVVGYCYDDTTGDISDKYVVFDVRNHTDKIQGRPDGMSIDEEDNLWIALYTGGAVIKVNSTTGALLQVIPMPASYVTSTMWGGPNLDVLFVTTSRYPLNETERQQQPAAGAVFKITGLGTKGLPVYEVDLLDSIHDNRCRKRAKGTCKIQT